MRIWTDDKCIEIDQNDIGDLIFSTRFKSEHIKAKADPELFSVVADALEELWDAAMLPLYAYGQVYFGGCFFDQEKNQHVVTDGYCHLGEQKEGAENG